MMMEDGPRNERGNNSSTKALGPEGLGERKSKCKEQQYIKNILSREEIVWHRDMEKELMELTKPVSLT